MGDFKKFCKAPCRRKFYQDRIMCKRDGDRSLCQHYTDCHIKKNINRKNSHGNILHKYGTEEHKGSGYSRKSEEQGKCKRNAIINP